MSEIQRRTLLGAAALAPLAGRKPRKHHRTLAETFTDGVGLRDYHIIVGPQAVGNPSGPTLIFQDTFATGTFTKWNSCQWSSSGVIRNDNCQTYNGTSDYSAAVASDGGAHTQAARFEVRDGDSPFSGTERSEIAEAPVDVVPGDERWISWDMKFDATFPVPTGDWCIPWQWHGNAAGTSPPLCLDISSGSWGTADWIYLANNDTVLRTPVQQMVRGVWQSWTVHTKFSDSSAVGFAEVWIDGVQKVALHGRKTMVTADSGNYFKCGLYRDPVNTATAILWHDNVTVTGP